MGWALDAQDWERWGRARPGSQENGGVGPGACPKQAFDSAWPEGEALPVPGLAEGQARVCLDLVPARGGGPPPPCTSSAPRGPLGLWQDHGCWAQRRAWHTAGGLYGTALDSDCPAAAVGLGQCPQLWAVTWPQTRKPRTEAAWDRAPCPLGESLNQGLRGWGRGTLHTDRTPAIPSHPSAHPPRTLAALQAAGLPSCANTHGRCFLSENKPPHGAGPVCPRYSGHAGIGAVVTGRLGGPRPSMGASCTHPRRPSQEPRPRWGGAGPPSALRQAGPSADLGACDICTVFCADFHATCNNPRIF